MAAVQRKPVTMRVGFDAMSVGRWALHHRGTVPASTAPHVVWRWASRDSVAASPQDHRDIASGF
jgi:hypothetical protein